MSAKHSIEEKHYEVADEANVTEYADPDAEFGGVEERRRLERKLLWKLDCRMSIMVLIYILNYVRYVLSSLVRVEFKPSSF